MRPSPRPVHRHDLIEKVPRFQMPGPPAVRAYGQRPRIVRDRSNPRPQARGFECDVRRNRLPRFVRLTAQTSPCGNAYLSITPPIPPLSHPPLVICAFPKHQGIPNEDHSCWQLSTCRSRPSRFSGAPDAAHAGRGNRRPVTPRLKAGSDRRQSA